MAGMVNTGGWASFSVGKLPSENDSRLLRRESPLVIRAPYGARSLPLSFASEATRRLPASALVPSRDRTDEVRGLFFPPGEPFGATEGLFQAPKLVLRALRVSVVDGADAGALYQKDRRAHSCASQRYGLHLASRHSNGREADVGELPGCRAVLSVVQDMHCFLREKGVGCSELLDQADRPAVAASRKALGIAGAFELSAGGFGAVRSDAWGGAHMSLQNGVSPDSFLFKSHADAHGGVAVAGEDGTRHHVVLRVLLSDSDVDHVVTEYVASESGERLRVTAATRAVFGDEARQLQGSLATARKTMRGGRLLIFRSGQSGRGVAQLAGRFATIREHAVAHLRAPDGALVPPDGRPRVFFAFDVVVPLEQEALAVEALARYDFGRLAAAADLVALPDVSDAALRAALLSSKKATPAAVRAVLPYGDQVRNEAVLRERTSDEEQVEKNLIYLEDARVCGARCKRAGCTYVSMARKLKDAVFFVRAHVARALDPHVAVCALVPGAGWATGQRDFVGLCGDARCNLSARGATPCDAWAVLRRKHNPEAKAALVAQRDAAALAERAERDAKKRQAEAATPARKKAKAAPAAPPRPVVHPHGPPRVIVDRDVHPPQLSGRAGVKELRAEKAAAAAAALAAPAPAPAPKRKTPGEYQEDAKKKLKAILGVKVGFALSTPDAAAAETPEPWDSEAAERAPAKKLKEEAAARALELLRSDAFTDEDRADHAWWLEKPPRPACADACNLADSKSNKAKDHCIIVWDDEAPVGAPVITSKTWCPAHGWLVRRAEASRVATKLKKLSQSA